MDGLAISSCSFMRLSWSSDSFLNALQTLIEVIARLAGAGGYEGGVTRGGLVKVFGMRQLSRRAPRQSVATRQSMGSESPC